MTGRTHPTYKNMDMHFKNEIMTQYAIDMLTKLKKKINFLKGPKKKLKLTRVNHPNL
jgi:hypothetical protein